MHTEHCHVPSLRRREFVAGTIAAAVVPAAVAAAPGDTVTPEMFGAKGDGRTNDTQAFNAMSAQVRARGGGTIVLRPVTYIVGEQRPAPGGRQHAFNSVGIIYLARCAQPISIRGNGATLRLSRGLRYGRFDPQTGAPLPDPEKRAFGNEAMLPLGIVNINHCSGSVSIDDLEIDGNLQALAIGGHSVKNSWESGGSGIWLAANTGSERLSRLRSHHNAADGIILKPTADRSGSTLVTDTICEFNGRQACSITGGRNLTFERCKFNRTGRAGLHHAPGHGLDIEAEVPIRNVTFTDCEFADNITAGAGIGRQTDTEGVSFNRCKFIGTTNWSAWLDRPAVRVSDSLFVGAMVHVYGDPDASRAAQFRNCTFTDDPALSPTGQVFLGPAGPGWIALLQDSPNVSFTGCHFRLVNDGLLPLSGPRVIYADCDMSQRSPQPSTPRGTYIGTDTIRGNANLQGSVIRGKVTLNGRPLAAI